MSTRDHSPRLIIVMGAFAALASCTISPAHAGADLPSIRHDEDGKACPFQVAPVYGLHPLTFCTPALPPEVYLHPAYPEVRPSYGSTSTRGTVTTTHGTIRFDSTTKH